MVKLTYLYLAETARKKEIKEMKSLIGVHVM